jgi:hypothetical protein
MGEVCDIITARKKPAGERADFNVSDWAATQPDVVS